MAQDTRKAIEPVHADGLSVDVDYLRLLMGVKADAGQLLESVCSEACMSVMRSWFDAVGDRFRETHLLSFLRRCTSMNDARILDIFDLLDVHSKGFLHFPAFHFLVSILAGRAEGRMKRFLYLRGRDSFAFLTAVMEPVADSKPGKAKATRLFQFLTAFDFDKYAMTKLHELQLAQKQFLTENEISLFLFAVCEQYDDYFNETSHSAVLNQGRGDGLGDEDTPVDEEDAKEQVSRKASMSKLCNIS